MLAYAGQRDLGRREPVDIGELVGELRTLLGATLSKKAQLELAVDARSVVLGDRATLTQVLMNLLTNASDALGDQAGIIRVVARRISEPDARWDSGLGATVRPGRLGADRGARHRLRHGRGHARARVRAVLLDQGARPRPGPGGLPGDRVGSRRLGAGRERGRARQLLLRAVAGQRRRAGGQRAPGHGAPEQAVQGDDRRRRAAGAPAAAPRRWSCAATPSPRRSTAAPRWRPSRRCAPT